MLCLNISRGDRFGKHIQFNTGTKISGPKFQSERRLSANNTMVLAWLLLPLRLPGLTTLTCNALIWQIWSFSRAPPPWHWSSTTHSVADWERGLRVSCCTRWDRFHFPDLPLSFSGETDFIFWIGHSLIITREGLILTLSICSILQGWIQRASLPAG